MRKCLLDSSFLVDLLKEMAAAQAGAALNWLERYALAHLWITPVAMAEVLEGAEDPEAVRAVWRAFLGKEFTVFMRTRSHCAKGAPPTA